MGKEMKMALTDGSRVTEEGAEQNVHARGRLTRRAHPSARQPAKEQARPADGISSTGPRE